MKLVVIILSLFLIAPSYAMQDCETNLVSSSLLENVVALENLFKKLEPLNLQYELIAPRLRENLGSYEIHAFARDHEIGNVLISRQTHVLTSKPLYRSHILIHHEYQRLGVGSMLYVMAAQLVFDYGGVLQSTPTLRSKNATDLWKNLKRIGWAMEHTAFAWTLLSEAPNAYFFRQDLLAAGFFKNSTSYITDKTPNGFEEPTEYSYGPPEPETFRKIEFD